jgi:hypothetical protein
VWRQRNVLYVVKKISTICLKKQLINIYKIRYKYFRSGIIYVQNWHFYLFNVQKAKKKTQLTKIKQQNCIGIRAFDSRLYLDISRSFKCPKCSPVVCLICITCGRFVSCFCIVQSGSEILSQNNVLSTCLFYHVAGPCDYYRPLGELVSYWNIIII